MIRRWNDSNRDIKQNDKIIVLTDNKELIGRFPYTVTNIQSVSGPLGQDAYLITLDYRITTGKNFVFALNGDSLRHTTYQVRGDSLLRNNSLILSGVEDFQCAYFVDVNGNNEEEMYEWFHNLSNVQNDKSLINRIKKIRYSIVQAVRGESGYEVDYDSLRVENHTYKVKKNYRRDVWRSTVGLRNIR